MLNVHNGCSPPSQVSDALTATQNLLQTCDFTIDQTGICNGLKSILDTYSCGGSQEVLNDLGEAQNYFQGGESADSSSDVAAPNHQNVSYLVYVIPSVVGALVIALIVALFVVRMKKNEKPLMV